MAYTKNTWASGDVVTSAKLNHMENGIEAASSPYDLVIMAETEDDDITSVPASAYHITHGSIEACEQKIANMEPVNVFVGFYRTYNSEVEVPDILYSAGPMHEFSVTYRFIDFNYYPRISYTSNYEIDMVNWD